jgi:hypothetical protein
MYITHTIVYYSLVVYRTFKFVWILL